MTLQISIICFQYSLLLLAQAWETRTMDTILGRKVHRMNMPSSPSTNGSGSIPSLSQQLLQNGNSKLGILGKMQIRGRKKGLQNKLIPQTYEQTVGSSYNEPLPGDVGVNRGCHWWRSSVFCSNRFTFTHTHSFGNEQVAFLETTSEIRVKRITMKYITWSVETQM